MRRAQIKMMETIAVLIVFFFLLMIGFSIYAALQKQYYQEQQSKNAELQALQVMQKASYLPELQCSIYGNQRSNCFDIQKARIFFEMTHDPVNTTLINRYYGILRHSTLYIDLVYPDSGDDVWLYNQSLEGNDTQVKSAQVPVSVYNAQQDRYGVGILYINYTYEREK